MNLRLPDELHAGLTKAAAQNRRSLHAEILARLELSFAAGRAERGTTRGDMARDTVKSRRARTGLCEHRLPPEAYCGVCDK